MNGLKIIGMDPSLSNFGFAKATLDPATMLYTVDELVLVKTENEKDKKLKKTVRKNSEDLERARALYEGMIEACQGATLAIAEVPVGSQSARAMASYGVCVGVLAACPIPLIQVTPSEVKLAGTGYKSGTKDEMIEWAMNKFPAANWLLTKRGGQMVPVAANEHLADAVGAIEAGLKTDQLKQAIALMRGLRAAA
jgi:Holliday junction resolvasome RuvABC endonuclease subunit